MTSCFFSLSFYFFVSLSSSPSFSICTYLCTHVHARCLPLSFPPPPTQGFTTDPLWQQLDFSKKEEGGSRARVFKATSKLDLDATFGDLGDDEFGGKTDGGKILLVRVEGLEDILNDWGLSGVAVWEDVLSTGEQQRLSFARVLYSQPG